MTAAERLERAARTKLFRKASNIARSRKSSLYQFRLKPVHMELRRLALNE
jgi:hypothetical protein